MPNHSRIHPLVHVGCAGRVIADQIGLVEKSGHTADGRDHAVLTCAGEKGFAATLRVRRRDHGREFPEVVALGDNRVVAYDGLPTDIIK